MFHTLAQINFAEVIDNIIHLRITGQVFTTCVIFSVIGAIILSRFTGSFGNVTYPLNFAVLFLGAVITNSALRGIDIPVLQHQHQVLMFTVAGMLETSFTFLWLTGARKS